MHYLVWLASDKDPEVVMDLLLAPTDISEEEYEANHEKYKYAMFDYMIPLGDPFSRGFEFLTNGLPSASVKFILDNHKYGTMLSPPGYFIVVKDYEVVTFADNPSVEETIDILNTLDPDLYVYFFDVHT